MKVLHVEQVSKDLIFAKFDGLFMELKEMKKHFQPKEPTEYLTASELRKLLKISKPTEMEWRRKGVIQAYKIGGRIYYKRHEVESCMTQVLNR